MLTDLGSKESPGDCPFPGWEPFLPQLVHPLKVAIVEAILCVGEPLSAVQLGKVLRSADEGFCESNVRYHLRHLVQLDVLEPTAADNRGGPREKFFYFANDRQKSEVEV
jgi:hypothetical protein